MEATASAPSDPSSLPAAAGAPVADTPAIAAVRALLDKHLRVLLTDGRVLVGRFQCFDKQRNVLLTETREYRKQSDGCLSESCRSLGIVLVPRRWIAACHAADVD